MVLMKNSVFFLGILFVLVSCGKEKKMDKPAFELYKTSELAALMEEMYVFNDSLKQQILKGEVLAKMPYDLQQIHSLEMTDRFERDENFKKFAAVFERYQSELYSVPTDSLKLVYNNSIQTCVACHQTSCTGPIPRIKKLLID